jgi:hypothetical protein
MHAFTRINRVIGHVIKAMITSLEICTYKYVVVVHYSTSIKRVRCLCPARPPSSTSTPHCRTCRSHHFLFPCSLTVSVLLVAQPPGCHHSDPLHASTHHYWMRSSLAWKTSSCVSEALPVTRCVDRTTDVLHGVVLQPDCNRDPQCIRKVVFL